MPSICANFDHVFEVVFSSPSSYCEKMRWRRGCAFCFLCLCFRRGFINTAWKVSKYGVFSGPYFPVIGLNTEIYGVNLYIQSEYRKIRTSKNSAFGHFSRSAKIFTFKSKWIAMTGLNLPTGACKKKKKKIQI